MRQPPRLGPRTVECTATAQYRPDRGPRRTSSCSCSRVTGGRSTAGRDDSAPRRPGGALASGAGAGGVSGGVAGGRRGGRLGSGGRRGGLGRGRRRCSFLGKLARGGAYRASAATIRGNTSRGASRPKNTSMWV